MKINLQVNKYSLYTKCNVGKVDSVRIVAERVRESFFGR